MAKALICAVAAALLAGAAGAQQSVPAQPRITEFPIPWPPPGPGPRAHHGGSGHEGGGLNRSHGGDAAVPAHGSTHEIAFDPGDGAMWVSGQNFDALMRMDPATGAMTFHAMPPGSRPHGLGFDGAGRLWATLEYHGRIARIGRRGEIAARYDVRLHCRSCPEPINPHPHGLGIGADGATLWFTGKATGTVGRLTPDGRVRHWALPTVGSVPIYIRLGPDGNMWVTELVGNAIARVTADGAITEYPIPTANSRPIAIVPGPAGEQAMWFSEEAGNKVGRIDLACLARAEAAGQPAAGCIAEFAVPGMQPNVILAGLAFDGEGNLWVQQYVDQNRPDPAGTDHIVRIDRAGLAAGPEGMGPSRFTFYPVPTQRTVMHRIVAGPDGAMWFTEMGADRAGRIAPR